MQFWITIRIMEYIVIGLLVGYLFHSLQSNLTNRLFSDYSPSIRGATQLSLHVLAMLYISLSFVWFAYTLPSTPRRSREVRLSALLFECIGVVVFGVFVGGVSLFFGSVRVQSLGWSLMSVWALFHLVRSAEYVPEDWIWGVCGLSWSLSWIVRRRVVLSDQVVGGKRD